MGLTPTKTLESLVHGGGVTAPVDGVMVLVISGLRIFVVNDTVDIIVDEVGPSISKGGVAILNVGLSESKYVKVGGDTLSLSGEGGEGG